MLSSAHPSKEERTASRVTSRAEDFALSQAAAGGEAAARRKLVERLSDRVRATVAYLCGAHRDADDYAQMAFIEILDSIGSYRGESSLEVWAERITVRCAMRQVRKLKWRSQYVALSPDEHGTSPGRQDDQTHHRLVSQRLAEVLGTLKPKQRVALTLRILLGHSVEEVSEITGANINTVKYRLRVGRETLRQRILEDPVLAQHYREDTTS